MNPYRLIESDVYDVLKTIEKLADHAKVGDVTGIAYMVFRRNGGYSTGFAGRAYAEPEYALGALQMLEDDLKTRAREQAY